MKSNRKQRKTKSSNGHLRAIGKHHLNPVMHGEMAAGIAVQTDMHGIAAAGTMDMAEAMDMDMKMNINMKDTKIMTGINIAYRI